MAEKTPFSRRIFIRAKDRTCQIFTFTQNRDGSIYCSFPDFADAKWLSIQATDDGLHLIGTKAIGSGKASFHGSGMVAVRSNSDPKGHRLVFKGNHLLDKKKGTAGMRHLFTIFMKEPTHYPETSPLFNRNSDCCMEANEELRPLVLVFFAVPQKGIVVKFEFGIHERDLVNFPEDILGLSKFGLRYHDVIWFAYRTRYMEKWPKEAHICYLDGHTFPIFVGAGPGVLRLEYRRPQYSLSNHELSIDCHPFDHSLSQIKYCCEGE
jgi:hypothetical protein